ncbi:MAG: AAA family ATPase [Gemmatimonadaceae bacterium]|nr:AAA family ATPase [Gemmatimonadaceae bacterium]
MIESIRIAQVATYGDTPVEMAGLSQFNYVYGSNGSGKTTISRIIADETAYPTCQTTWKGGTKLQALVYNSDFVERNFNQSTELKGVFTLGQDQAETLARITAAKTERDQLTATIENLTRTLRGDDGAGGKTGELATLENGFKAKCWAQKQKHDAKLQGAFEGYRNKAENFKTKVLQESGSNQAALQPLADLEKKAETIFGQTPTTEPTIASIDTSNLLAHEGNPILKKRVIGKDDVDIAAMITRLGNSDWVQQGRSFYEVNDRTCPFCQQSTDESFARSLNEYFDETFTADSKAIDGLVINYTTESERVQQQLAAIIGSPSRFLDVEKLKSEKELLDAKITLNNQRLAGKKKEASQVVELEPLGSVALAVTALIDSANSSIADHNRMVANLGAERKSLTAQVWRFVLEELKTDLAAFKTAKDGLSKAISNLNDQIATATQERSQKTTEIQNLEKQTTSVQPTINAINALLSSFGFHAFALAKAANGTSYKLVRQDGTDAKTTLSEGEKNFVTFLYFYHLLKGSHQESGMTADRVVVFDDPVSSLDSDILFIVGSLIKGLFEEVRGASGHVRQVFVLTHNVYFHREITFNPRRSKDQAMNEETFWVARKSGAVSMLDGHSTNPIKTSYELLWSEVRNPNRSSLTIQNTLRRILENYFKILGGVDPDQICTKFEGKEKLICKSLFSWVNAGSHHALDDLFVSSAEATVDVYLQVFMEIFRKSDHWAHYRMMMGDAYVEESVSEREE